MTKDMHYLPHLTWPEVREALERTDVAILPIGAVEQHGPALPLGTDTLLATEVAREAARRADAICVPSIWMGLSRHHMAFPGTLTLSEDTFVKVVLETAACLAQHGFRKILLYNGHGGNEVAMAYLCDRIMKETPAQAMLFGIAELRKIYLTENIHLLDIHAGIGETSGIMNRFPELVAHERIEKPKMTLDPYREQLLGQVRENPALLRYVTLRLPPLHEISSNGCITYGDPHDATPERGRSNFEQYVAAVVEFIAAWRRVTTNPTV